MRTIETEADVAAAVEALAVAEPRFGAIAADAGMPPLRRAPAGLPGLLRIVTDQQISIVAAAAIWNRFETQMAPFEAARLLAASDEALRTCGLSAGKVRTIRAVAEAVAAGRLDFDSFASLPDDEVGRQLIAVHGIGRWTADIYLLSCLGRSDVWPVGDLALRAAAQAAFALPERPSPADLERLAEPWRPWRSVAARLLWSHYRRINGRPAA